VVAIVPTQESCMKSPKNIVETAIFIENKESLPLKEVGDVIE
jgi:hypothetical protein